MHFRTRHLFRTDAWIEYGNPIELPHEELPKELVDKIGSGDWMEPPADLVTGLRDQLKEKLEPMTPNRDTFSEVHRDGVIAHVKRKLENKPELTWREEVLEVRRLKNEPESEEIQDVATRIGDRLDEFGLDGRDINSRCDGMKGVSIPGAGINLLKLIPFVLLLPILTLSMGWQIALGRMLGDKTDEGLDARTSYHMLFGMFGSMLWWPILATILTILILTFNSSIDSEFGLDIIAMFGTELWQKSISLVIVWIILMFSFWLSGISFASGWDAVADFSRWRRRSKINQSLKEDIVKLRDLLN